MSVVEAASGQCQKQSLGAGTGLRLAAPFQQFIEADGILDSGRWFRWSAKSRQPGAIPLVLVYGRSVKTQ